MKKIKMDAGVWADTLESQVIPWIIIMLMPWIDSIWAYILAFANFDFNFGTL